MSIRHDLSSLPPLGQLGANYRLQKAVGGKPLDFHACNCIGPQDGKPLCPCRMRNVTVKDGRYVEVIDHGPVLP